MNFQVTAWNPAAEKIFGYGAEEAIGQKAAALVVPNAARTQVDQVMQDLLTQTGGARSIHENVTKDGRTIICEWYNTPLANEAGAIVGVASLALDITARKQAEAALQQAKEAAESPYRPCSKLKPN